MGAPASTPGQIPNYTPGVDCVGSQNLPPPLPGSTSPLYCDYVKGIRLPESTSPSQNIPPFSTTICDPPRIYSSLPEYTPIFNNYKIMRPSQNLPLPSRIFFSSGSKWSIVSQLQKRLEKGVYSVMRAMFLEYRI